MFTCCGPLRLLRAQLPNCPATVLVEGGRIEIAVRRGIGENLDYAGTQLIRLLFGKNDGARRIPRSGVDGSRSAAW